MQTDNIPQEKYDEILRLVPIVCVDVAIYYSSGILLIKRRDEPCAGQWWLPGGRLRRGERLEDCAIRKAKEETGLDCEFGWMEYYASTVFETVHSVNFVYSLYASNDKVILDDTCLDHKWIYQIELNLHEYIKKSLWNLL